MLSIFYFLSFPWLFLFEKILVVDGVSATVNVCFKTPGCQGSGQVWLQAGHEVIATRLTSHTSAEVPK